MASRLRRKAPPVTTGARSTLKVPPKVVDGIPAKLQASIEHSLQANRQAQRRILETLRLVAAKKIANRKQAKACLAELHERWSNVDAKPPPATETEKLKYKEMTVKDWKQFFPDAGKKRTKTPAAPSDNLRPDSRNNQSLQFHAIRKKLVDDSDLQPADNMTRASYKRRKLFRYDSERKWTRSFFIDPAGSIPPPNDDLQMRNALIEGSFFGHLSPPFTSKEDKALMDAVDEVRNGDEIDAASTRTDDEAFWEKVATKLTDDKLSAKRKPSTQLFIRTAKEYEIRHDFIRKPPKVKLSKEECLLILDKMHRRTNQKSNLVENDNGQPSNEAQQPAENANNGTAVDWFDVAASINEKRDQGDHQVTAFDCLRVYETQIKGIHADWTVEEDRILLTALAALGPQYMLDFQGTMLLSSLLGHTKNIKQILARVNHSLLNPQLHRTLWSKDDQRKLVLCMKVYRNDPSPTHKAGTFHFPHRNNTMVAAKWSRSLNPNASTSAELSAEEDE
mmetsp:Transcript_28154/g.78979  ORF Transcript_28154/g.78979 Transcript_28154/m.78979 type:complete len:506 (-) Transcript_28154:136-1653(-)